MFFCEHEDLRFSCACRKNKTDKVVHSLAERGAQQEGEDESKTAKGGQGILAGM